MMVSGARKQGQYRCTNTDCGRTYFTKFKLCQKCAFPLEVVDPEKPPTAVSGTGGSATGISNPGYHNPMAAVPTDWATGQTDPDWASHPCEVVSLDVSDLAPDGARALLDVLAKTIAARHARSPLRSTPSHICPLHGTAECSCAQRKRLGYDLVWFD